MSSKPRAPSLRGIEVRTDSRGQKRYRGMARDRLADKNIKGPWTTSHSEARSWRIDAKARIQAGTLSGHLGPTVGDAAKEFVIGIKNGSIRQRGGHTYKPSTARGYEHDLEGPVAEGLGRIRIGQLRRPEVQQWIDSLTASERSAATVRNIVAALRALLSYGELRGWVHLNPCRGVRVPAARGARERIASPDEAAELIEAMAIPDRATLGFAVYAGLRLGELLALERRSIDLEAGMITVERSWDPGGREFVETKSRTSRRVPIIECLAALLAEHPGMSGQPESGLVFPSHLHPEEPMDPAILRRRAYRCWADAGLQRLGFHEGRHTFASIAIAAGLNAKTLSTYMGHSTITITLDRYGHLMPGSEVEARALLDSYLNPPPAKPLDQSANRSDLD
jgi:integrase